MFIQIDGSTAGIARPMGCDLGSGDARNLYGALLGDQCFGHHCFCDRCALTKPALISTVSAHPSRRRSPPLAPPGAADRHQERQRHQDPRQQRQLVDAGHRVALVAPQPDPVRAAGGAAGPDRADARGRDCPAATSGRRPRPRPAASASRRSRARRRIPAGRDCRPPPRCAACRRRSGRGRACRHRSRPGRGRGWSGSASRCACCRRARSWSPAGRSWPACAGSLRCVRRHDVARSASSSRSGSFISQCATRRTSSGCGPPPSMPRFHSHR